MASGGPQRHGGGDGYIFISHKTPMQLWKCQYITRKLAVNVEYYSQEGGWNGNGYLARAGEE